MGTKITFESELDVDYDLYNDPVRKAAMLKKIEDNVKKFGSIENFYKKLTEEVIILRSQFEPKLQVFWTWKEQLGFIEKVMKGEIKEISMDEKVDLKP